MFKIKNKRYIYDVGNKQENENQTYPVVEERSQITQGKIKEGDDISPVTKKTLKNYLAQLTLGIIGPSSITKAIDNFNKDGDIEDVFNDSIDLSKAITTAGNEFPILPTDYSNITKTTEEFDNLIPGAPLSDLDSISFAQRTKYLSDDLYKSDIKAYESLKFDGFVVGKRNPLTKNTPPTLGSLTKVNGNNLLFNGKSSIADLLFDENANVKKVVKSYTTKTLKKLNNYYPDTDYEKPPKTLQTKFEFNNESQESIFNSISDVEDIKELDLNELTFSKTDFETGVTQKQNIPLLKIAEARNILKTKPTNILKNKELFEYIPAISPIDPFDEITPLYNFSDDIRNIEAFKPVSELINIIDEIDPLFHNQKFVAQPIANLIKVAQEFAGAYIKIETPNLNINQKYLEYETMSKVSNIDEMIAPSTNSAKDRNGRYTATKKDKPYSIQKYDVSNIDDRFDADIGIADFGIDYLNTLGFDNENFNILKLTIFSVLKDIEFKKQIIEKEELRSRRRLVFNELKLHKFMQYLYRLGIQTIVPDKQPFLDDLLNKKEQIYSRNEKAIAQSAYVLKEQIDILNTEQKIIDNLKENDPNAVPFYFQDLRNNRFITFHAFIESINDSFSPAYETIDSIGRIEPIQIYKSTTRKIDVNFMVYSSNVDDFKDMWRKLNDFLMLIYPQFSRGRQVVGGQSNVVPFSQIASAAPVVRMRIGDLIKSDKSKSNLSKLFGSEKDIDNNVIINHYEAASNGLAGVIDSLSYSFDSSTWEINPEVGQAPKMVKIQIGFTVIHDIIPGLNHQGKARTAVYNVGNINTINLIADKASSGGGAPLPATGTGAAGTGTTGAAGTGTVTPAGSTPSQPQLSAPTIGDLDFISKQLEVEEAPHGGFNSIPKEKINNFLNDLIILTLSNANGIKIPDANIDLSNLFAKYDINGSITKFEPGNISWLKHFRPENSNTKGEYKSFGKKEEDYYYYYTNKKNNLNENVSYIKPIKLATKKNQNKVLYYNNILSISFYVIDSKKNKKAEEIINVIAIFKEGVEDCIKVTYDKDGIYILSFDNNKIKNIKVSLHIAKSVEDIDKIPQSSYSFKGDLKQFLEGQKTIAEFRKTVTDAQAKLEKSITETNELFTKSLNELSDEKTKQILLEDIKKNAGLYPNEEQYKEKIKEIENKTVADKIESEDKQKELINLLKNNLASLEEHKSNIAGKLFIVTSAEVDSKEITEKDKLLEKINKEISTIKKILDQTEGSSEIGNSVEINQPDSKVSKEEIQNYVDSIPKPPPTPAPPPKKGGKGKGK